ncbi:MAG: hypothetical protein HW387_633 [Parachlamydiales bacterium]|nr:hypothetical protein [Parachlamydiales bacterium]
MNNVEASSGKGVVQGFVGNGSDNLSKPEEAHFWTNVKVQKVALYALAIALMLSAAAVCIVALQSVGSVITAAEIVGWTSAIALTVSIMLPLLVVGGAVGVSLLLCGAAACLAKANSLIDYNNAEERTTAAK